MEGLPITNLKKVHIVNPQHTMAKFMSENKCKNFLSKLEQLCEEMWCNLKD